MLRHALRGTNNRTVDKPLEVPFYPFPYFEGMNKIGMDKYWLGLYWRNNQYDISTSINLGKMMPKKWGIELPMNYSVGEQFIDLN